MESAWGHADTGKRARFYRLTDRRPPPPGGGEGELDAVRPRHLRRPGAGVSADWSSLLRHLRRSRRAIRKDVEEELASRLEMRARALEARGLDATRRTRGGAANDRRRAVRARRVRRQRRAQGAANRAARLARGGTADLRDWRAPPGRAAPRSRWPCRIPGPGHRRQYRDLYHRRSRPAEAAPVCRHRISGHRLEDGRTHRGEKARHTRRRLRRSRRAQPQHECMGLAEPFGFDLDRNDAPGAGLRLAGHRGLLPRPRPDAIDRTHVHRRGVGRAAGPAPSSCPIASGSAEAGRQPRTSSARRSSSTDAPAVIVGVLPAGADYPDGQRTSSCPWL